jgi:sulfate adenylyltransferase subunit 2
MNPIIWLTGLPCSGKTTIAKELAPKINATILDGDEIRDVLKNNDFSTEGRKKHMLGVADFAYDKSKESPVIVSLVSPVRSVREEIKKKYENVIEFFIDAPLDKCIERDVKGMYKKALSGEIKDFTGVQQKYEEPKENFIRINTDNSKVEECVDEIISHLNFSKEIEKVNPTLVSEATYIVREFKKKFKKPVMLWSMGKDSTALLHLVRDAFYGEIPFPIMHIDTGYKFPQMYEYRDRVAKELGLNLIVESNKEAIDAGFGPEKGRIKCCDELKTKMLKESIEKHGFDGVLVAIRRDEHAMRNIESYFSVRGKNFEWINYEVKDSENELEGERSAGIKLTRDVELSGWSIFPDDFGEEVGHIRVHPLLKWEEIDVWKYIRQKNIEMISLYFSKDGKRYRSIGCIPCTSQVDSDAKNVDEVISELKETNTKERDGRKQDNEEEHGFEKLRKTGYM